VESGSTRRAGARQARGPAPDGLAEAAREYLRESWQDPDLELTGFAPFGDGHSGETFRATLTAARYWGAVVLRMSAKGVAIAGPADVGRQGRIMGALHDGGAPAPAVLAADSGPVVDGRAVAVMQLVPGEGWEAFAGRRGHRTIAAAAVAALKAVHRLATADTGIGDDIPFGLLEEVDRWSVLLRRCPGEILPAAQALREKLRQRAGDGAPSWTPVLVHGDYHYGNLLFGADSVVAVLDWEIAALGHPLTDLGCLAVASLRRRYRPDPNPAGDVDLPLAELAELYGAAPEALAWHTAACCLKYAAIIGYNLHLHRSGKRDDPIYESLQRTMHHLLADGAHLLDAGLGDR
jgi:aminoglycoside phosphotransferase (APT) family kinase protein